MMKILISYDMQKGKEQECQEYLVNKLAPGLGRLGFRFGDVWYTIWGKSPQILGGGEVKDQAQAQEIFTSDVWRRLSGEMEGLTENFKMRLVRGRAGTTVGGDTPGGALDDDEI
ncbi:MAG: hypothetical protein ACRC1H_00545 [Caldilineaceae bacterium]